MQIVTMQKENVSMLVVPVMQLPRKTPICNEKCMQEIPMVVAQIPLLIFDALRGMMIFEVRAIVCQLRPLRLDLKSRDMKVKVLHHLLCSINDVRSEHPLDHPHPHHHRLGPYHRPHRYCCLPLLPLRA